MSDGNGSRATKTVGQRVQGSRRKVLTEIEEALKRHRYIRAAIATMRVAPFGRQIVAYIVPATLLSRAEVASHCRKHLPARIIPTAIIFVPSLPLTRTGKIDRRALSRLPLQDVRESNRSPVGQEEMEVEEAFTSTLGLERIGRQQNFFELGGHSLAALRVIAELNKEFGTSLTLADFFGEATVAGLAAKLKSSR